MAARTLPCIIDDDCDITVVGQTVLLAALKIISKPQKPFSASTVMPAISVVKALFYNSRRQIYNSRRETYNSQRQLYMPLCVLPMPRCAGKRCEARTPSDRESHTASTILNDFYHLSLADSRLGLKPKSVIRPMMLCFLV